MCFFLWVVVKRFESYCFFDRLNRNLEIIRVCVWNQFFQGFLRLRLENFCCEFIRRCIRLLDFFLFRGERRSGRQVKGRLGWVGIIVRSRRRMGGIRVVIYFFFSFVGGSEQFWIFWRILVFLFFQQEIWGFFFNYLEILI